MTIGKPFLAHTGSAGSHSPWTLQEEPTSPVRQARHFRPNGPIETGGLGLGTRHELGLHALYNISDMPQRLEDGGAA